MSTLSLNPVSSFLLHYTHLPILYNARCNASLIQWIAFRMHTWWLFFSITRKRKAKNEEEREREKSLPSLSAAFKLPANSCHLNDRVARFVVYFPVVTCNFVFICITLLSSPSSSPSPLLLLLLVSRCHYLYLLSTRCASMNCEGLQSTQIMRPSNWYFYFSFIFFSFCSSSLHSSEMICTAGPLTQWPLMWLHLVSLSLSHAILSPTPSWILWLTDRLTSTQTHATLAIQSGWTIPQTTRLSIVSTGRSKRPIWTSS